MILTEDYKKRLIAGEITETRLPGWYWVKPMHAEEPIISKWDGNYWRICGLQGMFGSANWSEIDERRIVREE